MNGLPPANGRRVKRDKQGAAGGRWAPEAGGGPPKRSSYGSDPRSRTEAWATAASVRFGGTDFSPWAMAMAGGSLAGSPPQVCNLPYTARESNAAVAGNSRPNPRLSTPPRRQQCAPVEARAESGKADSIARS